MHNLEMLPLARSPKRDRFGDLSTHHQVGGGGIWQAVEAEPGASGWRRLDPLSSRLDLVGPLATATGSLRGAAPSPLQLHVTTEGLGSASSSSRPPPPGAGGVGWARCPQLAAPSDGGLLPPLSPSPPPTGCPCVQRWVWDGTRGATRAGDVALPSSRRRPGLCVEGLASEARTSSYARFGCRHVPLVATNLFPFSLVPSILCLLPSPLQTWAYSIVLWFAGVIPRSKSSHFQLALDNWSRCLFWDLCSSSTLAGLCSVPSAEVAVDDLSSVNSPP